MSVRLEMRADPEIWVGDASGTVLVKFDAPVELLQLKPGASARLRRLLEEAEARAAPPPVPPRDPQADEDAAVAAALKAAGLSFQEAARAMVRLAEAGRARRSCDRWGSVRWEGAEGGAA